MCQGRSPPHNKRGQPRETAQRDPAAGVNRAGTPRVRSSWHTESTVTEDGEIRRPARGRGLYRNAGARPVTDLETMIRESCTGRSLPISWGGTADLVGQYAGTLSVSVVQLPAACRDGARNSPLPAGDWPRLHVGAPSVRWCLWAPVADHSSVDSGVSRLYTRYCGREKATDTTQFCVRKPIVRANGEQLSVRRMV